MALRNAFGALALDSTLTAVRDLVTTIRDAVNTRATANGGAHLIGGTAKKWRREFTDPTLAAWDVVGTWNVAGGNATFAYGTTNGNTGSLTSKETFTAPFKVAFGFNLSQKIANNELYLELVALTEDGSALDENVVAAWRINGSDSTTATVGRVQVNNSGATRNTSGNITGITTQTAPAVYEITLESDETWFTTKAQDNTGTRTTGTVRNSISPDPNRKYKVRIVAKNVGVPATATTLTLQYVTAVDYTELQAEITGGNGNTAGGQSIPVNVNNSIGFVAGSQVTPAALATGTGLNGQKVISTASNNAVLVKASAGRLYGYKLANLHATDWRYLKIFNKATAPAPGTDTAATVVAIIPLPPGRTADAELMIPLSAPTGLGYAITAAPAETDNTAIGAGEVVGTLLWI